MRVFSLSRTTGSVSVLTWNFGRSSVLTTMTLENLDVLEFGVGIRMAI